MKFNFIDNKTLAGDLVHMFKLLFFLIILIVRGAAVDCGDCSKITEVNLGDFCC